MSTADWWARRLNAPPPERLPQAPASTQTPYQTPQGSPATQTNVEQAQAAHNYGLCPECGSANYFESRSEDVRMRRMPAAGRCFDCGYPIHHTTSGMGSRSGTGDSSPSRQNNARGTSNYNPGNIVGRVG